MVGSPGLDADPPAYSPALLPEDLSPPDDRTSTPPPVERRRHNYPDALPALSDQKIKESRALCIQKYVSVLFLEVPENERKRLT
jgi:hypothetical protein